MAYTINSIRKEIVIRIPLLSPKPMGLGVISRNGKVFVSMVIADSLAAELNFQVKDRIVAVGGVLVTDKWQCEEEFLKCAKSGQSFDVSVLRIEATKVAVPPTNAPEPTRSSIDLEFTDSQPSLKQLPGTRDKLVKLPKIDYMFFCRKEDETSTGQPLFRLSHPAPPDICRIITKELPKIQADFLALDSNEEKTTAQTSPLQSAKSFFTALDDLDEASRTSCRLESARSSFSEVTQIMKSTKNRNIQRQIDVTKPVNASRQAKRTPNNVKLIPDVDHAFIETDTQKLSRLKPPKN